MDVDKSTFISNISEIQIEINNLMKDLSIYFLESKIHNYDDPIREYIVLLLTHDYNFKKYVTNEDLTFSEYIAQDNF